MGHLSDLFTRSRDRLLSFLIALMVEAVRLRKPALDAKSHSITCTKTVSGSVLTGCLLFSKLISSHNAPAKPVEEDKKREKS
jgi:hypothetical protein